jgi:hypothetical protein
MYNEVKKQYPYKKTFWYKKLKKNKKGNLFRLPEPIKPKM